MPAAEFSGGAPADPSRDGGDPTAEPFLLESLLAEIRSIRGRSRQMLAEASSEATRQSSPDWRQLQKEIGAACQRAERTLVAAAARDHVPLAAIDPSHGGTPTEGADETEDPVCRFRQLARELEQHSTSVLGQAQALGLMHLAHALDSWRREWIGLEQPLIRLHARRSGSRRA